MPAHHRIRRGPAQIRRRQDHVARTSGSRSRAPALLAPLLLSINAGYPARRIPMKALLSKHPGGPETLVLDDIPEPIPGPGEVRIAVRACGVNYPDLLIIQDLYQYKPPRPFA